MSTLTRLAVTALVLSACAAADLDEARLRISSGETHLAERIVLGRLARDPESAESHYLLGLIRLREARLEQALAEFERAKELDARYEGPTRLAVEDYLAEASIGVQFEMFVTPDRERPVRMRRYSPISGKRLEESRPGWERQSVVLLLPADSVRSLASIGMPVEELEVRGDLRRVRVTGWVRSEPEHVAAELCLLDWEIHYSGGTTARVMVTLENVGTEVIEHAEVRVQATDQLYAKLKDQRIPLTPHRIEGGKTGLFSMLVPVSSTTLWISVSIRPYGRVEGQFGRVGEWIFKSKEIRPATWPAPR
jgi:hypothetical protein